MPDGSIAIRPAAPEDMPALLAMQARSMRRLGRGPYAPREIEAYIATVGTMDAHLVDDGTYWVALLGRGGPIAASGGWSLRAPGYAGRARGGVAEEAPAAPKIRSVIVDPDHARAGLGRAIMERAETDIAARGFGRAGLVATLMGVPFYTALGYRPARPVVLDLGPGTRFAGLAMEKALPAAALRRAA